MTATVRSTGIGNSSSSLLSSFSPAMPTGFVAGDLLIGIAGNGSGTVPSTRPSGSTSVINIVDGTVYNLDVVRKVAVGGDTFTWTTSTSNKWAGCVIAITAGTYDTGTPISSPVGVAQGTTASTAFVTPSSTPTNADSLTIAFFGQQGAATWVCNDTVPTMVELADTTSTGTSASSVSAYRSSTPHAATAFTRTGTASLSSANGAQGMLQVNPAVAATLPILVMAPRL